MLQPLSCMITMISIKRPIDRGTVHSWYLLEEYDIMHHLLYDVELRITCGIIQRGGQCDVGSYLLSYICWSFPSKRKYQLHTQCWYLAYGKFMCHQNDPTVTTEDGTQSLYDKTIHGYITPNTIAEEYLWLYLLCIMKSP